MTLVFMGTLASGVHVHNVYTNYILTYLYTCVEFMNKMAALYTTPSKYGSPTANVSKWL